MNWVVEFDVLCSSLPTPNALASKLLMGTKDRKGWGRPQVEESCLCIGLPYPSLFHTGHVSPSAGNEQ